MTKTKEMANALRKFADDIEQGIMPAPYYLQGDVFWSLDKNGNLDERLTVDDAREAMSNSPGGWNKQFGSTYLSYEKEYGGEVSLRLNIDRDSVCTRVQVGTKLVEAVEAHEEPVYEWLCDDDDDHDS